MSVSIVTYVRVHTRVPNPTARKPIRRVVESIGMLALVVSIFAPISPHRGGVVFVVSTLVFLGCAMAYYLLDDDVKNEVWCRASHKKMAFLALIWLGQAFPVLFFIKWATHGNGFMYFMLVPWALLGSLLIVRPTLFSRITGEMKEKENRGREGLDKWTPPGFP